MVPKRLRHILGSQFFGHETQLDKRAHAGGQQAVVDLIHVAEVELGMALGIFVIDSDFVVKDGVEAHVFESGNLLDLAEIVAIAIAQR